MSGFNGFYGTYQLSRQELASLLYTPEANHAMADTGEDRKYYDSKGRARVTLVTGKRNK